MPGRVDPLGIVFTAVVSARELGGCDQGPSAQSPMEEEITTLFPSSTSLGHFSQHLMSHVKPQSSGFGTERG